MNFMTPLDSWNACWLLLPQPLKAEKQKTEDIGEAKQAFERQKSAMRMELDQELRKVDGLYEERCRDYAQMVSDDCEAEVSKAVSGEVHSLTRSISCCPRKATTVILGITILPKVEHQYAVSGHFHRYEKGLDATKEDNSTARPRWRRRTPGMHDTIIAVINVHLKQNI